MRAATANKCGRSAFELLQALMLFATAKFLLGLAVFLILFVAFKESCYIVLFHKHDPTATEMAISLLLLSKTKFKKQSKRQQQQQMQLGGNGNDTGGREFVVPQHDYYDYQVRRRRRGGGGNSDADRNDNESSREQSLLPLPLRVMERYVRWHGVDALRREAAAQRDRGSRRKYAVALFACPDAAGNRLFEFYNAMMWSIATNRTLLFKYLDAPTYRKYAPLLHFNMLSEQQTNTQQECEQVLRKQNWIPSFDEFFGANGDDDSGDRDIVVLPLKATRPSSNIQLDRGKIAQKRVVVFPRKTNAYDSEDFYFNKNDSRKRTLHRKFGTAYSQRTVKELFQLGRDFVYGMLHQYSFQILVGEDVGDGSGDGALSNVYSVALHSRHNDTRFDGCDISREKFCIRQLLKTRTTNATGATAIGCRVVLMSDRQCTVDRLREWLTTSQVNCEALAANHSSPSKGFFDEHGPFAGAGYFRDLQLALRYARHGVVGTLLDPAKFGPNTWRSSSAVVRGIVQYRRIMDAWFVRQQQSGEVVRGNDDDDHAVDLDNIIDTCVMPPLAVADKVLALDDTAAMH